MSKIEKSYEYKSIQGPVHKEGMKKRFINHESCDCGDGYGPRYWYHGWEKSNQWYRKIERFIEKHIGNSFNETYSKFLKTFLSPDKFICRNTARDIFLSYFSKNFKWSGKYEGDYYLDEDGNIQKYNSNKVNRKVNKTPISFIWNKNDYPITNELLSILKMVFGDNEAIITERVYNKNEMEVIYRKIKQDTHVVFGFGDESTQKLCGKMMNSGLSFFVPVEYAYIESSSFSDNMKKYYMYKHEMNQIKKYRNWKRSYDGELYLRTYKLKQKEQELLDNDITIERLGFDKLTSFRGLEYHGQKRKRKSSV